MTELLEDLIDESRRELAVLINAEEKWLVFVPNATAAVNTVLNSLHLKKGGMR